MKPLFGFPLTRWLFCPALGCHELGTAVRHQPWSQERVDSPFLPFLTLRVVVHGRFSVYFHSCRFRARPAEGTNDGTAPRTTAPRFKRKTSAGFAQHRSNWVPRTKNDRVPSGCLGLCAPSVLGFVDASRHIFLSESAILVLVRGGGTENLPGETES